MKHPHLITLLTDFGNKDVYVGVMKGVIAQIDPDLQTVDLTHDIPPQSIAAARFNLMNAVPYFPKGTVHIAVVDPDVGRNRRAIAIKLAEDGYVVAPDNGLVSGILAHYAPPSLVIVELANSTYWRTSSPSATFHGRDIFAPVGAHLALGTPIETLGPLLELEELVQFSLASLQRQQNRWIGCVQHIDHFGNIITTIPGRELQQKTWAVEKDPHHVPSQLTYGSSAPGSLLALVGSHGWVEIAVNQGSAAERLKMRIGDRIDVVLC